MKAKHLGRALLQIAEEGAARVFKPGMDPDWIVGVVGALQFDVLADRIRTEYDIPVKFETSSLHTARWLECEDSRAIKGLRDSGPSAMAEDHDARQSSSPGMHGIWRRRKKSGRRLSSLKTKEQTN